MTPQEVPEGPLLVDTDVFTWLTFRSGRSRWAEFAALVDGHPLALPFVIIGELRAGAIKAVDTGAWTTERRDRLEAAIHKVAIASANDAVTDVWARLYAKLHDKLKGGGVNDMWAAACALAYGAPIVTGNLTDYRKISDEFPDLAIIHPDM